MDNIEKKVTKYFQSDGVVISMPEGKLNKKRMADDIAGNGGYEAKAKGTVIFDLDQLAKDLRTTGYDWEHISYIQRLIEYTD